MKRTAVRLAKEALERAAQALAEAQEDERLRERIAATEPANRRIVRFSARFPGSDTVYSFCAIRADHYRGDRRWFVSQNNIIDRPVVLRSPATWVELVEFAIADTIYVAPLESGWKPVSNLPVRRASQGVNYAELASGHAPKSYWAQMGTDLDGPLDLDYNG